MIQLGLDIATRKTGILVADTDNEIVLYRKTLLIDKKVTGFTRIVTAMYEAMSEIMEHIFQSFQIDRVVIEDVLEGAAMFKAALSIHASRTAATLAIIHKSHLTHEDIVYYSPQVVKYSFTKKRGADKSEMLDSLKLLYPQYNPGELEEDELDALALVLYDTFATKNPPKKGKK